MKTNQFRAMMLTLLMAIIFVGAVNAQSITVSGLVTDEAGEDSFIPGCSVMMKGTTRGVLTGIDGRYTIQAEIGEELVFSYIGSLLSH